MTLPAPLAYPDCEQAVLGALLIEPGTLAAVRPLLPDASHFTDPRHALAYRAMLAISDRGGVLDHITLAAECPGHEADFSEWLDAAVGAQNAVHHAAMLADATARRQTTALAERLAARCRDISFPLSDTLAGMVKAVAELHGTGPAKKVTLTHTLADLVEGLGKPPEHGATRGVPSGLKGLDDLLDGFGPGLHILAANPSEGKSALALRIARRVAESGPVWINSLEMGQSEIVGRLLQAEVGKSVKWLTEFPARLDEWIGRVNEAAGRLAQLPITITEGLRTPSAAVLAWQAECAQGRKPMLVVIDYLQLMHSDQRNQNRNLDLADVTGPLKQWSLQEKVPILLLSQLSRENKRGTVDPLSGARSPRKPQLHDLRDSGSIEQDADTVTFLYWPEAGKEREVVGPEPVDLIVAKHRNGPKGTARTRFRPWIFTFEDAQSPP